MKTKVSLFFFLCLFLVFTVAQSGSSLTGAKYKLVKYQAETGDETEDADDSGDDSREEFQQAKSICGTNHTDAATLFFIAHNDAVISPLIEIICPPPRA